MLDIQSRIFPLSLRPGIGKHKKCVGHRHEHAPKITREVSHVDDRHGKDYPAQQEADRVHHRGILWVIQFESEEECFVAIWHWDGLFTIDPNDCFLLIPQALDFSVPWRVPRLLFRRWHILSSLWDIPFLNLVDAQIRHVSCRLLLLLRLATFEKLPRVVFLFDGCILILAFMSHYLLLHEVLLLLVRKQDLPRL